MILDWIKKELTEKTFETIKNLSAVFILISTLFGGLWQFIELLKIEIGFIRFFSLTQMIQDGFIFLLVLFIISLISYLAYFSFLNILKLSIIEFIKSHFKPTKDYFFDIKKNSFPNILIGIIFITIFYALTFYVFLVPDYEIISIKVLMSVLFNKTYYLVFVYFLYSFLANTTKDDTNLNLTVRFPMLLIFFAYTFFVFKLTNYHSKIPSNLKNYELFYGKESKENLLYFNDKYLFTELEDGHIKIYDFDQFIKEENGKKIKDMLDSIQNLNQIIKQNNSELDSLKFKMDN
jgi:hypothetical protein